MKNSPMDVFLTQDCTNTHRRALNFIVLLDLFALLIYKTPHLEKHGFTDTVSISQRGCVNVVFHHTGLAVSQCVYCVALSSLEFTNTAGIQAPAAAQINQTRGTNKPTIKPCK